MAVRMTSGEGRVRVPATSANLGCGFDTTGVALARWLEVSVRPAEAWSLEICGSEVDGIPVAPGANIIVAQFLATLKALGVVEVDALRFAVVVENHIPIARGLGSSAAAIVAAIACAFQVAGYDLEEPETRRRIAELATMIEGHPDNAVPAVYGNLQLCLYDEGAEDDKENETVQRPPLMLRQELPFPATDIGIVLHIPFDTFSTEAARAILPQKYERGVCARNTGRLGMLVSCLLLRDYRHLHWALADEIHEPWRRAHCPSFDFIKSFVARAQHRTELEIYGAFLSGAGPSTVILCRQGAQDALIAHLTAECPQLSLQGQLVPLEVAYQGLHQPFKN